MGASHPGQLPARGPGHCRIVSADMPPARSKKQRPVNSRSPVTWFILLLLVCANLVTFFTLWALIGNLGKAAASLAPPPVSSAAGLLLPEPVQPGRATATATRVVNYTPTATQTPLPTPTLPPSPTPTEPPAATAPPPPPTAKAPETISYVVIISIDGLRPDALEMANTPTLDRLRAAGAYSARAQTVKISETLPGHASMLSGMTPEKHGILWGAPYIGWPGINGPTLFSVARAAGLKTAMVFGKEKLSHLVLPDSVDMLFGADTHDDEVKQRAVEFIEAGMPHVLFIHLPDTDRVGHAYGWLSANQLDAITYADGVIGNIVAALEAGGYLSRTLLIVTSDHGGRGFVHGDDSPEDRTIPWLAIGPGVPPGITLSGPINIYDTAATALTALRLPVPENWDGRPVQEIFGDIPANR